MRIYLPTISAIVLPAISGFLLSPAPCFAQSGSESTVGYIDGAIPTTQFRIRYDAAWNSNRPNRAEFFYPKSRAFNAPPFNDARARGPLFGETRVDYQDLVGYLECAPTNRLSGFIEAPVRFLDLQNNPDASGFSDLIAGFKYAVVAEPNRYVTFQFRTFIPTGDAGRGLGTGHVSLEPGILYYRGLTERLVLEAEVRDWIPIDGSDFAGNVLRYGVGLGYTIHEGPRCRITPVTEFVGWTVLSGKESVTPFPNFEDAGGDTIMNLKFGARVNFGNGHDIYVGYGRALTGDVWYRDVVRVEYRRRF